MNDWYKLIIFAFIVVGPAIVVGVSNYTAFPDSFGLATVMLIVTVGVAGVFTWKSSDATPKIVRYCIVSDVIICAVLCANMAGHWILAREVSGAKQGTAERHSEEDREENRKTADLERQLALKKAEAELQLAQAKNAEAERRRLRQLPWEQRYATATVQQSQPAATVPTLEPAPTPEAKAGKPRLNEEQVRDKWWWFLTALAIAECAASVLAGGILIGVWEWDRNHDGVDDKLQQGTPIKLPVDLQEFPEALPTGRLETGKDSRR
jgi:hypothetical protein